MDNITNIPAPRVPLIDANTGLISREWYRFFLNLFTITGAGTDDVSVIDFSIAPLPTDSSVSTDVSALLARFDSIVDTLAQDFISAPIPDALVQSSDFDLSHCCSVVAANDDLSPRVELGTMATQNAESVAITGGSVQSAFKSSDGSAGYTGTLTTASLVGKTVTIKDGIITSIA